MEIFSLYIGRVMYVCPWRRTGDGHRNRSGQTHTINQDHPRPNLEASNTFTWWKLYRDKLSETGILVVIFVTLNETHYVLSNLKFSTILLRDVRKGRSPL